MKINMEWEDDKVTCISIDGNKLTLKRPLTMDEAQKMIELAKEISRYVYLFAHEITAKEQIVTASKRELQLTQKISRKGEVNGSLTPKEVRKIVKIVYPELTESQIKKKAIDTMKNLCKQDYWSAVGATKNRQYLFDRAQWKHDLKKSVTPAK